ncbi:DUF1648 domain-containing protein [Alloiococcus sp. CFN-8]|uniref:DUF1648 domain-containing protein n=1 Tax=Alloiococcus sp. CFN-8 TaxID=3416081 RepID=UPI003CE81504
MMKIKNSKFDIFASVFSLLLLIGLTLYLLVFWDNIAQDIPSHYNGVGEADIISSKTSLLFTLAVAWILFIGLTVIERYPQIWNTGVTITENNRERVYRTLKNMLNMIKLTLVGNFFYTIINSSLGLNLSPYFLPVFLILIFGTLTFFIVKLVKTK